MDTNAIANLIISQKLFVTKNIDVTVAHSYKGDMEGLLLKSLGITPSHVNTIIAVNGFDCSSDYNGETDILLIQSSVLEAYLG